MNPIKATAIYVAFSIDFDSIWSGIICECKQAFVDQSGWVCGRVRARNRMNYVIGIATKLLQPPNAQQRVNSHCPRSRAIPGSGIGRIITQEPGIRNITGLHIWGKLDAVWFL